MKTIEDFEINQKEEDFEDEKGYWWDERTCPVCGKKFDPLGSRQKYCSQVCREERNRRATVRHYHMKTGTPTTDWKRDMRKEACIRCGFQDIVILHDVIPVVDGGDRQDSDNRIPLCPNCHSTLHRNKWKIWDIEDKLLLDPKYVSQYWLTQILKSEDYEYPKNASRFASS